MKYVLGRRTRRYTALFGLTPISAAVMVILFVAALIGVFALGNVSYVDAAGVSQSLPVWVVAVYLIVVFGAWAGIFLLIRQPKDVQIPPLVNRITTQVRDAAALVRSADAFRKSSDSPRPRPVGPVLPLSVTDEDDRNAIAVIRHDGHWGSR